MIQEKTESVRITATTLGDFRELIDKPRRIADPIALQERDGTIRGLQEEINRLKRKVGDSE